MLVFVAGCALEDQDQDVAVDREETGASELPGLENVRSGDTWCITGDFFRFHSENRQRTSVIVGLDEFKGETWCRSEGSLTRTIDGQDVRSQIIYFFDRSENNVWVMSRTTYPGETTPRIEETFYVGGVAQN